MSNAKFVNIHPFADGNGRTSRLLINFELMKAKYPPVTIEKDDRFKYYEVLDVSGEKGDYEPFTEFVAERGVKALEDYLDFLEGYQLNNDVGHENAVTFNSNDDFER